ncbi:MAG TPA: hypothetical protein VKR79_09400 [Gaiellaceae bacterium]|nr:hypothetical protein [Gaiellaceae bacterium]
MPGIEWNERLTAVTGAVLIVLLAALGVTILSIGQLIWWHVLLGMLLIPPVLLKLASTGWRFVRYYSGTPEYVRRGPPQPLLRLLAPLVVVSTLVVFGTGVALLVVGPSGGILVGLHKASFVVWFLATAVHVLAHLRRLLPAAATAGAAWRGLLVGATIVAGVGVAVMTVRYAHPWVHWFDNGRGRGDG